MQKQMVILGVALIASTFLLSLVSASLLAALPFVLLGGYLYWRSGEHDE